MRLNADKGGVAVVAHRGVAGLAPENTLAGIEAALELGVDIVEVDVSLWDGKLVLAHSHADAGPGSPGLAEALSFFAERASPAAGIQVDVKPRGVEGLVVESLEAHGLLERALVSSMFSDVLQKVRRLEPSLATGLAYPHDRVGLTDRGLLPESLTRLALVSLRQALPHRIVRMARAARADVVVLHHLVASRRAVSRCRERGIAVYVWTVNDREALTRVLMLGVNGIITDDPELVLADLEA
jgi:glycerophosphoryl diester phosphodiesterase